MAHKSVAPAFTCLSTALRITSDPMFKTRIKRNADSRVRATLFSMDAQVNSVEALIGGPAVGLVGSAVPPPAALVTTGLARLPVSLLFARLALGGVEEAGSLA